MGGAVELVSYMYGPGFIGRRLIDGLNEPTWSVTETPAEETMFPRLRINTLGQVLEEPVTIAPDQTTSIALRIDGDRFVIRR
jgi:hypothetical protein